MSMVRLALSSLKNERDAFPPRVIYVQSRAGERWADRTLWNGVVI